MTPEQYNIRRDALIAAMDYGYAMQPDGTLRAPPGKFEGEPFYVLHYYDEVLNGGGYEDPLYDGDTVVADILVVSNDERAAFELAADTEFMALWYSDSGFVHLDELTAEQYDELRDAYSDEGGDNG